MQHVRIGQGWRQSQAAPRLPAGTAPPCPHAALHRHHRASSPEPLLTLCSPQRARHPCCHQHQHGQAHTAHAQVYDVQGGNLGSVQPGTGRGEWAGNGASWPSIPAAPAI